MPGCCVFVPRNGQRPSVAVTPARLLLADRYPRRELRTIERIGAEPCERANRRCLPCRASCSPTQLGWRRSTSGRRKLHVNLNLDSCRQKWSGGYAQDPRARRLRPQRLDGTGPRPRLRPERLSCADPGPEGLGHMAVLNTTMHFAGLLATAGLTTSVLRYAAAQKLPAEAWAVFRSGAQLAAMISVAVTIAVIAVQLLTALGLRPGRGPVDSARLAHPPDPKHRQLRAGLLPVAGEDPRPGRLRLLDKVLLVVSVIGGAWLDGFRGAVCGSSPGRWWELASRSSSWRPSRSVPDWRREYPDASCCASEPGGCSRISWASSWSPPRSC